MFSCILGIIGKPNVGKSTFINSFFKKKINTVSKKKFTTQNYNISVLNELNNQFIIIDTPGIEFLNYKIKNKYKILINSILKKINVLIYILDIKGFSIYDKIILNIIKNIKNKILIVNKIDLINNNNFYINFKNQIELKNFKDVFYTSALSFKKTEIIKKNFLRYFKKNQFFFKKNFFINKNFNDIFINIIKEKFFIFFNKEIPYNIDFIIKKIILKNNIYKIFLIILIFKKNYKKIILGINNNKIIKIIKLSQINLFNFFKKKFLLYINLKYVNKSNSIG